MSEELEQPQVEDSTELPEPEDTAEGVTDSEDAEGEELDNEQSDDSEEEEVEYEGKHYKVPKELKEALLRQADYTRKTQEVAEVRKQVEAQQARMDAERQFTQAHIRDVARIEALDQQLAQYGQVNWDALIDSDPQQAMKLERQARELQAQRAQLAQAVTQKQHEFQQSQQQEAARQIAEGQRVLSREIPGWGPELAQKLIDYGRTRGYPDQVLFNVTSPAFVMDLYNSYQFAEIRKKATQKPKPVQEKPVTRIQASKSKTSVDPDRMSPDQWLKWRNSQVRAKR